jgi:hydroxypyruvate isomerase
MYKILRYHWCDNIILNVYDPREDKINYVKNSFYKELESAFDKFPKCFIKILLEDFNVKVVKEDIFKAAIQNETLCEELDEEMDINSAWELLQRISKSQPKRLQVIMN